MLLAHKVLLVIQDRQVLLAQIQQCQDQREPQALLAQQALKER